MRALITGIGGFAGRHLARHLHACGDEVFGIARPGHEPALPHTKILPADVRDPGAVIAASRAVSPQAVYHLAALSHVGESWERRRETFETNFLGSLSVLEAARALTPRPRLLLVGSGEQYGYSGKAELALGETTPQRPVTPYGVSKAAQELLGYQYFAADDLSVIFARSFNHTGPGQSPAFVIPGWAKQIAEMERGLRPAVLEVLNLDSRRDFTDVRDIVRLYRLLIVEGRAGEAYNACSGVLRSLAEVIEGFRGASTVAFEVHASDGRRQLDVPVLLGSSDKAKREVGWTRRVPFEQTLKAVLDEWRRKVL